MGRYAIRLALMVVAVLILAISVVPLVAAVEEGVQLVSNVQLEEGLAAAGADAAISAEVLNIYAVARTQAFQAGISLLTYFSLLALILSLWLPKRKLVESEPEMGEVGELTLGDTGSKL